MEDVSAILKTLGDKTRFEILDLLLTHNYCVGALARQLQISEAAVSQHLQVLRKAGLVKGEKRGYWTHYTVERNLLIEVADALRELANKTSIHKSVCNKKLLTETDFQEGRGKRMCNCTCKQPDKLKEKPDKCTPEQIKECHGDEKVHPCEEKNK